MARVRESRRRGRTITGDGRSRTPDSKAPQPVRCGDASTPYTILQEGFPMTTKTNTNGQARKSLAEQIDRLDAVLDGLADGINDTVVAAVKEAVAAAVQAVLSEVLSSPELLARLGAAAPVAVPAAPAPEARRPPGSSAGRRSARA